MKCVWLTTCMLDLHMCMCVHTPHRENVIMLMTMSHWVCLHGWKPQLAHMQRYKIVHRTDNDAWTGGCRSYQSSVFFSITYFSTFMAMLYGLSFIGHLLWYMGFTILHTAGSHVVRLAYWYRGGLRATKWTLEYLCPKTCTHTLTQMPSSFASKLVAAERGHDLTLH